MKKKILIFRTDKIGDLLLSLPLIYTLKDIYKDSDLYLVGSLNNFNFAKEMTIFDEVYNFPLKGIFKKIRFFFKLSKLKYDIILVLDGKNRSIFSTVFLHSYLKISITTKKIHKFICKLYNVKFYQDTIDSNLQTIHQNFLNIIDNKKKIENYDYLNNQNFNSPFHNFEINNYIHFHFDEKWFIKDYIKEYTRIEPSLDELLNFLKTLSKINNVVITTGIISNEIYDILINNHFSKLDDKKFIFNGNKKIFFIPYPHFNDLIVISSKSSTLITCHGAMTHVANCFNVKIIDVIEKKKEKFDSRCTSYIKNYLPTYRVDFNNLQKNILDKN